MSIDKAKVAGKYFVNTYGCQMNVHESEKISGIFFALGMVEAETIDEAEYVVYNTCCVRETAETRVFGHLGKAKKLKEANPLVKIILCGCMGQRPGGAAVLRKKFPFIDLIIGTHNIYLLGDYLSRLERGKITEIFESSEIARNTNQADATGAANAISRKIYQTSGREAGILRSDSISAFINIMQGCDNFCSYCIVPYVRGRETSRPKQDILTEINGLISNDYKEITLLGQNVNSYGKVMGIFAPEDYKIRADGYDDKTDFVSLMSDITKLDGKFWVKFMTSHPKDFTEDVARVMASSDKLKKHVHLPVQAGSDRILKQMNRGYTSAEYLKKVDIIRKYMPDAGITSDIMVGFPGETEDDFNDTMRLVQEVRYNNLFTFIYNKREGTPAATMDGQLSREVKIERLERLISQQNKIAESLAAECVGKTYDVLCEKVKNGKGFGKTKTEQPISFKAEETMRGKFIKVTAVSSKNSNIIGLVKE